MVRGEWVMNREAECQWLRALRGSFSRRRKCRTEADFRGASSIAENTGVSIAAGFAERNGEQYHIAHYIVFPGEAPFAPYRAFNAASPNFTALEFHFFEVNGAHCAIAICADSGLVGINEWLHQNGVQVLLLPTGAGGQREDRVTNADLQTPAGREKYQYWLERVFLPGRAPLECLEFRRALAAVNIGASDGHRFFHLGHGAIVNPYGEVVGLSPASPISTANECNTLTQLLKLRG